MNDLVDRIEPYILTILDEAEERDEDTIITTRRIVDFVRRFMLGVHIGSIVPGDRLEQGSEIGTTT